MRDACACVEGVYDPLADGVFVAVDAVQVDLVQDTGAGTGPGGDLGGFPAGGEPTGQRGVPQVVGAAGDRGGGQLRAERGLAGGVPGAAVDRFAEHAAAGAAEQPPVRTSNEVTETPPMEVTGTSRSQPYHRKNSPGSARLLVRLCGQAAG
jgi:hypothetical protein